MPERSRRVERPSCLMDGNNKRCLPDRKEKRLKICKKNNTRAKVLYLETGNFVWASGNKQRVICGSGEKFRVEEEGAGRE